MLKRSAQLLLFAAIVTAGIVALYASTLTPGTVVHASSLPQVDVSTGEVGFGTLAVNQPFEFTIPSAIGNNVTITAENSNIQPYQWFTPDPATIPAGSTSVNVEATELSPPAGWFTYSVGGMNVQQNNLHVIVDSGDGDAAKRAS